MHATWTTEGLVDCKNENTTARYLGPCLTSNCIDEKTQHAATKRCKQDVKQPAVNLLSEPYLHNTLEQTDRPNVACMWCIWSMWSKAQSRTSQYRQQMDNAGMHNYNNNKNTRWLRRAVAAAKVMSYMPCWQCGWHYGWC